MIWYEVWSDESFDMPHVLVLGQENQEGDVIVLDPKEAYKIIYRANNYEDAKLWLLEDEYTRVDGRITE